jgi:deoxycytidine triphosphate deaminase
MKLGGFAIENQFRSGNWRAYSGETLLSASDLKIGPNSVDVTLSPKLLIPNMWGSEFVDPLRQGSVFWEPVTFDERGYRLETYQFLLASVNERFVCDAEVLVELVPPSNMAQESDAGAATMRVIHRMAKFAPMYEGRSTLARLGITTHLSAGFGDYGFGGAFTLEIFNHFPRPVMLYPGMRIGQVAFEEVYEPKVYTGAYSGSHHNDGPVAPTLGPERF